MRGIASFAVAYDITDDKERSRVEKVLLGFGVRVQKSVFECRLSRALRERLIRDLEGLELATGHVILYQLQSGFAAVTVGPAPARRDESSAYVV